jgi:hypothetical protein
MKSMQSGGTAAADLLSVAPRLLVLSMESAQDFVSRATSTLPAMPGIDAVRRPSWGDDWLRHPETDACRAASASPPGGAGEGSRHDRVRNTVARTFSVVSTTSAAWPPGS